MRCHRRKILCFAQNDIETGKGGIFLTRRYDYDILRVFSMFAVVYLHTAAKSLLSFELRAVWGFSNLLAAIATPAVPLFFMLSGALLLNDSRTEDISFLLRRRVPRLLIPLCVWSCLVLAYTAAAGDPAGALESLRVIFGTPVIVPYWFLYALIPIYLLSPLLKKLTDRLSPAHWNYMMGLWLCCSILLYTVRSFVPETWTASLTEHWTLNLNLVGGYLGYFLLGAYLERLPKQPSRKVLWPAVIALLLVSIVGTRWDTYAHGAYSDRFTNYLSLFTCLLSAAIFLLARSYWGQSARSSRALSLLSGCSFCVYLLHPLALGLADKVLACFTGAEVFSSIGQQLAVYVCVCLFCVAIAALLSRIPVLDFLFTGKAAKSGLDKK